jgi:DNA-binding response OmpR family regulator
MTTEQDNDDDLPATKRTERLVGDLRSTYVKRGPKHDTRGGHRQRILIVEDRPEIRRLIRVTVQLEDYEVLEADTGDTGLAMALELKPDLVLLDIMMPGSLDGMSVCRAIKRSAAPPKVLLLTAMRGRQHVSEGREAGADAYLLKPFSPLELIDIINQQLSDV